MYVFLCMYVCRFMYVCRCILYVCHCTSYLRHHPVYSCHFRKPHREGSKFDYSNFSIHQTKSSWVETDLRYDIARGIVFVSMKSDATALSHFRFTVPLCLVFFYLNHSNFSPRDLNSRGSARQESVPTVFAYRLRLQVINRTIVPLSSLSPPHTQSLSLTFNPLRVTTAYILRAHFPVSINKALFPKEYLFGNSRVPSDQEQNIGSCLHKAFFLLLRLLFRKE